MTIRKGDTVRLVQPEIKGKVLTRQINKATDELQMLVEDAEGHRRWIDADKLELVERAPAAEDGEAVEITADDVGDVAAIVGGAQP